MARAIVLAVEHAPARSTYNIVDDQPLRYGTLYRFVAAQAGIGEPVPGGDDALSSLGCSNAKAALGWQPANATYRAGLT